MNFQKLTYMVSLVIIPAGTTTNPLQQTNIRQDYLENANLFADDVRKEHDSEERKKFKEELISNREKAAEAHAGSDLGLW